jgi:AraC-like DNA-binding protein
MAKSSRIIAYFCKGHPREGPGRPESVHNPLTTMNAQLEILNAETRDRQTALATKLVHYAQHAGLHRTPIREVTLARAHSPSQPLASVYEPCLCIVVQGRKRALVGNEVYVYDPLNYLVVSVTLPARTHIIDATPEQPYLCLRITMDIGVIGELLEQIGPSSVTEPGRGRGLFLSRMSAPMLDAVSRLVDLMDRPKESAVLAPLVLKEIHFRVLMGELGYRLRELCTLESHTQRISSVIKLLRSSYAGPVRVENLAAAANMSVSSLHHRFKEVTAMSPMQYLKHLRLHEARRLMLAAGMAASAASYHVGYESPSQFSRDYRRLFGAPPRREVQGLRAHTQPDANIDEPGFSSPS